MSSMRGYRQVVGGTDIVGGGYSHDLDTVFGGVVFGAEGQQMQQLQMRHASGVVDAQPTKSRRWPLGFPTTTVNGTNGTASPSAQPQVLFRAERLIIPSDFAGDLLITNVTVGQASQLAATNPIPARAFTEFGWGVDLYLDTADVSQFITLALQNTSSHNISFNAVFLGRAVA